MAAKRTHGHTVGRRKVGVSPTYRTWLAMRRRCEDPKHPHFAEYGGRGIAVCSRWREDFAAFLADMGERPAGKTLDRIEGVKGYGPGNCRWATRKVQQSNRRNNTFLIFRGERLTITEWARRTGIKDVTLRQRVRLGWSPERALTEPPKQLRTHTQDGR